MFKQFLSFFTSLDVFGEPVVINYKGETSFKTAPGALLTLAIKAFLLFFVVQGTFALCNYDDPQVLQVSRFVPVNFLIYFSVHYLQCTARWC